MQEKLENNLCQKSKVGTVLSDSSNWEKSGRTIFKFLFVLDWPNTSQ